MRTSRTRRRRTLGGIVVAVPLSIALGASGLGQASAANDQGNHGRPPQLEARAKNVITDTGRQFKDLNDNGRLDTYEDWRKPVEARVADLVGQMTLEEKAGLMLIDTLNASCNPATDERGTVPPVAADYIDTQKMHRFVFRNTVTSPDQALCVAESGGFGTRISVTPAEAAKFTNSVQQLSEATRLGIPSLFKSNARNHIDPDARAGINESAGAFSAFPKEAGIAAAALGEQALRTGATPTAGDMSVVEDFAKVMGDEWASIGLRGMYGYMADLSTEPRWYRTHETFTEDADLNANIMTTLVRTLQGPDRQGRHRPQPTRPMSP